LSATRRGQRPRRQSDSLPKAKHPEQKQPAAGLAATPWNARLNGSGTGCASTNLPQILCFNREILRGEEGPVVRGPWREVRSRLLKTLGFKQRSLGPIGLAAAVGVGYFLAARLVLVLLTQPDGLAVSWPAAGLSTGALIALGRKARWPVAAGVIAAGLAANLTVDRDILASGVFALCDAGETLLAAWLIERFVGPDFSLDKLRHVLCLLAVAVFSCAIAGGVGAVGFKLFDSSAVPIMIVWWYWLSSDAIGIITTAPLIIGAASVVRAPPPRREVLEGAAALIAVGAAMGTIIFVLPEAWWDRIVPVELLLPLLLWISARCRPAFTSAAVFVVSLTIVCAFIFRLGHFGDLGSSMEQRAFATKAAILGVAVFAYILSALFAERRQHAAEMEESANRMRAIVNTVVDGIIIIDDQGTVENLNPAAASAFGYAPGKVIGRNVTMLMPDLSRPERDADLAHCLETVQSIAMGAGRREMTGVREDGSIFPIELAVNEMRVAGRRMFTTVVRDVTARKLAAEQRKLAEAHQNTLMSELQHRTNNLLTIVQTIANRTLCGDYPLKEANEILTARLRALARANKRLTDTDWSGLTLGEIVKAELEPYLARCEIEGTDIMLGRQYGQNFSLVLHELATNAIKYGALSSPEGRVRITWGTTGDGGDSRLVFHWREQGGPPVVAPKRQGFGSTLLRATFPDARCNFDTNGFSCEIEVPFREASGVPSLKLPGVEALGLDLPAATPRPSINKG
jgi:PAS domain S-box-containing protein